MVEEIGKSNAQLRHIRRLARDRKYRQEENRYVVEGPTLVAEALAAGLEVVQILVPVSACHDEILVEAQSVGIPHALVPDRTFEGLTTTRNPQPAIAEVACHHVSVEELVATQGTILVLVGVSDPGNAGTLVRSAEAFGATGVMMSAGVDPYNPKVVRAAAGSTFRVPIAVVTGSDPCQVALEAFSSSNYLLVSAVPAGGSSPEDVPRDKPCAVFLGSESNGLNKAVEIACDISVSLPTGSAESLNVGIAGGVLLYVLNRDHYR